MYTIFSIVCILISTSHNLDISYEQELPQISTGSITVKHLPEPVSTLCRPIGFLVEIPAKYYDIEYVEFYALINEPFHPRRSTYSPPHLYQKIHNKVCDKWIYANKRLLLKPGYNVTYWMFVSTYDKFHFWLFNHGFTVTTKDGEMSLIQY